ncbi:MAG: tetratricopeptide (TPR) repeat protein [Planctomycetota bacterium]|jgi:tetratricopeptide (TPR) repeat protein
MNPKANRKVTNMNHRVKTQAFVATLLVAWLSMQAVFAQSESGSLAKATELLARSDARHEAREFAIAIKELREADTIFERFGPDQINKRQQTLRALIFHQSSAGQVGPTLSTVDKLASLVRGDNDKQGQLALGFESGVVKILIPDLPYKKSFTVLRRCGRAFKGNQLPGLEASSLHHQGVLAGENKQSNDMSTAFRKAIALLKKLDDKQALAWSYNSLATFLLKTNQLDDAMSPLGHASRLTMEGAVDHQAAMSINLESLIERLSELEELDQSQVKWIWSIAASFAKSADAQMVTTDYLLRTAARLEARNPKKATSAIRKLARTKVVGAPAEVLADLKLRAARLATDSGHPKEALKILKKLRPLGGFCAPLIEARIALEKSLALIGTKNSKKIKGTIKVTLDSYERIGSQELEKAALQALCRAFEGWPESPLAQSTQSAFNEIRRKGGRGGLGAQSYSKEVSSKVATLKASDVVFRIYAEQEKIIIEDIHSGAKQETNVVWQTRKVGLNGCAVEYFGGYVRLERMKYDQASSDKRTVSAKGGKGGRGGRAGKGRQEADVGWTLDQFKNYMPIPKLGVIEVSKNGAMRYSRK